MQRAAEPAGVLRGQGIIQAELVLSPFALGGGHFFHAVAVVGDKRVAGSEAGDIERQNGEQQHAQHENAEARQQPQEKPADLHTAPPPSSRT